MPNLYIPISSITEATASAQAGIAALKQPVTYIPKQKSYTITPKVDFALDNLRAKTEQLSTLLKKDRLAASEIRTVRTLIEAAVLPANRERYYLALQEKVNYQNQRNSQVKGYSLWSGTFKQWRNVGNEMCNLSSLGMALLYQGISMEDLAAKLKDLGFKGTPAAQYDDRLEQIRHQMAINASKGKIPNVNTLRRDTKETLKILAESFGLTVEQSIVGKRDYHWYQDHVLNELAQGHSIIMSYDGHIVRIQGVTEAGLVVDDPFGRVEIKKGNSISIPWNKNANSTDNTRITGEDRVLPWTQVKAHEMYWMHVIKQK